MSRYEAQARRRNERAIADAPLLAHAGLLTMVSAQDMEARKHRLQENAEAQRSLSAWRPAPRLSPRMRSHLSRRSPDGASEVPASPPYHALPEDARDARAQLRAGAVLAKMATSPLDEEMPVETPEAVRSAYEAATEVLIRKYDLPRKQFINELRRRLQAEEIPEEPDVALWQTLYGAMFA